MGTFHIDWTSNTSYMYKDFIFDREMNPIYKMNINNSFNVSL